jgi:hypothetical protein
METDARQPASSGLASNHTHAVIALNYWSALVAKKSLLKAGKSATKMTSALKTPSLPKKPSKLGASIAKKDVDIGPTTIQNTREFYLDDYPKTLFPLATSRFIVEHGEADVRSYIDKCLDTSEKSYGFASQRRVYVSKPGGYLRRTMKLDPVAEFYIYDLIFKNKTKFRRPHTDDRSHYGYRFEGGAPIAATQAYKGFKGALSAYSDKYKHVRGMDVATYFNNMYHHDIVNWFRDLEVDDGDAEGLGQVLREIASGRSIDCLPQGLYPSKMIGSDFLRFIDDYHDIKSDKLIRFMDDIYLFSDDERRIEDDFQTIQRLLGDRGLSLNSRKTTINDSEQAKIDAEIDQVKRQLLKRRRMLITVGYDDDGSEIVRQELIKNPLSSAEMSYINGILDKPNIEEEDAELLLTVMRTHANKVEKRLPYIMESYPHLAKNVYASCSDIEDKEAVADMIMSYVKDHDKIPESQLFWLSATLVDQLMSTSKASSLISLIFNHKSSTHVTMAKILEVKDARFGLQDMRNQYLSNSQSDWLGWASAVGSLCLKPGSRNQRIKYWAKGSNLNHLIANIILRS